MCSRWFACTGAGAACPSRGGWATTCPWSPSSTGTPPRWSAGRPPSTRYCTVLYCTVLYSILYQDTDSDQLQLYKSASVEQYELVAVDKVSGITRASNETLHWLSSDQRRLTVISWAGTRSPWAPGRAASLQWSTACCSCSAGPRPPRRRSSPYSGILPIKYIFESFIHCVL